MRSLLALSVALATLSGCTCGSYSAQTGMAFNEVDLDRDDYVEQCGALYGVGGSFDLMGDGYAWLSFSASHPNNDVDWAAVSITMELLFPNTMLVAGTHVEDTTGGAWVGDAGGNTYSPAFLTSAEVDVIAVREADEVCSPFRAQEFQLEWDIEWGAEGDEFRYTSQGKDWVSLFLDQSSSDVGCL